VKPNTIKVTITIETARIADRQIVEIIAAWHKENRWSMPGVTEPPTIRDLCRWCYLQGVYDGTQIPKEPEGIE